MESSIKLTVITHTRFDRPELLTRCKESVSRALPKNSEHLIIECKDESNWAKARLDAALNKDFVAFVDDDDTVHPDSFNLCLAALEQSNLGAACTFDCTVDIQGNKLRESTGERTYFASALHPRVVHHLCVMRSNLIDGKCLDLHNEFGVGIDWFIRQSVVQLHGCITVPMIGYYWTEHKNQHTAKTESLYGPNIGPMSKLIRQTWPAKYNSKLPIFDLTSF